jgi:hypothetical protein
MVKMETLEKKGKCAKTYLAQFITRIAYNAEARSS